MNRGITFQAESFTSYPGDWRSGESFELLQEAKSSPVWQAAWRFAQGIKKHGFWPKKHFIDRIAERGIGKGIRFDPKTFRDEFYNAQHYQQTRPGFTLRIAVVRRVPILYRVGGYGGERIVLSGALNPDSPLPPVLPASPPPRKAGKGFDREVGPALPGGGAGGPPDPHRQGLIRAATAISDAALKGALGNRQGAENAIQTARDALRRVRSSWASLISSPLDEAKNALRYNDPQRFQVFIWRAYSRAIEAMTK